MVEIANEGLPATIDGVTREELLWVDHISTTWRGWRQTDGVPCIIRCLRPQWKSDPVFVRRMLQCRRLMPSDTGLGIPLWKENGNWPHLLYLLGEGHLIGEHDKNWNELDWTIAIMGVLHGLSILHNYEKSPGVPIKHSLVILRNRTRLLWFDPFPSVFEPQKDFQQLSSWVLQHGPWHSDSVPALITDWNISPPPSIDDALQIAAVTMRDRLKDFTLQLREKANRSRKRHKGLHLWSLSKKLQIQPPDIDIHLVNEQRVFTKDKQLFLCTNEEASKLVFCPIQGFSIDNQRALRTALRQTPTQPELESLRTWLQLSMQLHRLNKLLRLQLHKNC